MPPRPAPPPPDEHPRLWFLGRRQEPAEGVATVRVDLPGFFVTLRRVGRDPALLLLTLRALRQRGALEALRLSDLTWVLRATRGEVLGWLDRLSRERLVVYDRREARDGFVVEIASEPPDPAAWPVDAPSGPLPASMPGCGRRVRVQPVFPVSPRLGADRRDDGWPAKRSPDAPPTGPHPTGSDPPSFTTKPGHTLTGPRRMVLFSVNGIVIICATSHSI